MIQELLPYVAGALQWARAQKRFAEAWFIAIVAIASCGFYLFANPGGFSLPWRDIAVGWWHQAQIILATVQLVSSGANILDSAGVKGMPVTNSK